MISMMPRFTQSRSRQQVVPPAPRLRARPGEIYRKKSRPKNDVDQPYWVVKFAFRLKDSPNIWQFILEERADLGDPSTPLSSMCLVESKRQGHVRRSPVVKEPVRDSTEIYQMFAWTDYIHGSRIIATTQELLNEFVLVSSGEVQL